MYDEYVPIARGQGKKCQRMRGTVSRSSDLLMQQTLYNKEFAASKGQRIIIRQCC